MEDVSKAILQNAFDFESGRHDCKSFLGSVVSALVQHIHHIPQELLSPLFVKKSAAIYPRSRRDESIEYIRKTKREDIACSNHVRNQLNRLRTNPSAFLDESSESCPRNSQANVLSILYDRIRETENDYVVTRSFSTTAIYLLAKDLMEQWGYTTLAGKARKELVDIIFKGRSGSDGWETVEENVKKDYNAGSRWYAYSQTLGGYGCFFFLPRIPISVYEVFLNKADHFAFAVDHFTRIGLPDVVEENKANEVGSKIMAHIQSCFASLRQNVASIEPWGSHSCRSARKRCTKPDQSSHGQAKRQRVHIHKPVRDASNLNRLDAQLADNAGMRSQLRHNTAQSSDFQSTAERVDVQNGIQCQANVNAMPGSDNCNDLVIEHFPSGDRAALQSLREGTPLMAPSFTDSSRQRESTAIAHSGLDTLPQIQQHQIPSMSSHISNSENKSKENNSAKPDDRPTASFSDAYPEQVYGLYAIETSNSPSQDLGVSVRRSQTGYDHTIENNSQEIQTLPNQNMAIQSETDRSQHETSSDDAATSCFNPDQNMSQENLNIQREYMQHIQSHPMASDSITTGDSLYSSAPNCTPLSNSLGIPTEFYPLEEPRTELYSFGEAPTELYYVEEHPVELYSLEESANLYNFDILTETGYGSCRSELDPSAFSGKT